MFKVQKLTPQLAHEILLELHELDEQRRISQANRQISQAQREYKREQDRLLVVQQIKEFQQARVRLPISNLIRWANEGGLYRIGERR